MFDLSLGAVKAIGLTNAEFSLSKKVGPAKYEISMELHIYKMLHSDDILCAPYLNNHPCVSVLIIRSMMDDSYINYVSSFLRI